MKKVRMGVIGLGGRGQGHIRFIKEIEEAELICVSDVDEEVTVEFINALILSGKKKKMDSDSCR